MKSLLSLALLLLPVAARGHVYINMVWPDSVVTDEMVAPERLVWCDEFDGTEVDLGKWNFRAEGQRRTFGRVDRRTIRLDGEGHCAISVLRDEATGDYCVGQLGTEGIFHSTYGYYECRAKMNASLGPHVAFWLQSPNAGKEGLDPGQGVEIDVFEYHRATPDVVYFTLHWNGYGAGHQSVGGTAMLPEVKDGWHTFGLKWTPEEYVFYVDRRECWRTSQSVSHTPEYLILSTELTGWGGAPQDGSFPDAVLFDYVRVYSY